MGSLGKVHAKYMDMNYHFYGIETQLVIDLSPGNCANLRFVRVLRIWFYLSHSIRA